MKTIASWAPLAAICFTVASCQKEAATPPVSITSGDTVATVGKTSISQAELDFAQSLNGRPALEVLKSLTEEEALAQLAQKEGFLDDPSVKSAIRRLLAARVREKLPPVAVTADELAEARSQALANAKPGTAQHEIAFIKQQFSNAGSEMAAKTALEQAKSEYLALASDPARQGFGALAAKYSDDTDTRYQGGMAGSVKAGEKHLLLPALACEAISAMTSTGLIPQIISANEACWLILVTDIRKPEVKPPSDAALRTSLQARKEAEQSQRLLEKALTNTPINILKTDFAPAQSEKTAPTLPSLPTR